MHQARKENKPSSTSRLEWLVLALGGLYLLALFGPWLRLSYSGESQNIYGWDSLLGVVCGLLASALVLAAYASSVERRIEARATAYLAVALAFFTGVRLIDEMVLRSDYELAWASYGGMALAAALPLFALAVAAGGWQQLIGRLPDSIRFDRL